MHLVTVTSNPETAVITKLLQCHRNNTTQVKSLCLTQLQTCSTALIPVTAGKVGTSPYVLLSEGD